jgi:hypothetical protein
MFQLPQFPCKILAAPNVRKNMFLNIIDWSPQSMSDASQLNN